MATIHFSMTVYDQNVRLNFLFLFSKACQPVRQLTSTRTTGFNQSIARTTDVNNYLLQSSKTSLNQSRNRTTDVNNSRYTELNHCNLPGVKQSRTKTTGLSQHKPSDWKQSSPPSSSCSESTPTGLSSSCGSRWTCFLTYDPPTNEQKTLKGESGVIITRPHPFLHASSMFETGEDFSIDEF